MDDHVTLQVNGLDGLLRDLRTLPQVLQNRLMKGMVATGASVIRKAAIDKAPVYTGDVAAGHPPPGTLKKAIYQARIPSLCTATVESWLVSVRKGKKAQATQRGSRQVNLDAFYASWVEFGHYTRAPKSAGATQKARRTAVSAGTQMVIGAQFVMPQPFMRPAFELNKEAAVNAMRNYLAERLPDAVAGTAIAMKGR